MVVHGSPPLGRRSGAAPGTDRRAYARSLRAACPSYPGTVTSTEFLTWHDGALGADPAGTPDDDPTTDGGVLVADSWLVADGRVRALEAHRTRFVAGVSERVPDLAVEVDAFWAAAVARLPRTGAWFPRVEVVTDGAVRDRADTAPRLRLLVRPAPPRRQEAVVATAPRDPRTTPRLKGPDLAALGAVRDDVRALGADEAVLLAEDGAVAEGAWSSLVWWEGDALCVPPDDVPHLPGVTLGTLVALATALGVDVRRERRTPADLEGREAWLLSALHGARIVTRWVDGPSLAEEPGRLRAWRTRLDALRRPL